MKRYLIAICLIFLNNAIYSQIRFEKGYFIDNNEKKITCYINNVEWKDNPVHFEYRIDSLGKTIKGTVDNVKGFGIGNSVKYIRSDVKIDISSDDVRNLSRHREPEWQNETLFLKVLVEGKANLYYYEKGKNKRFFYNVDDMKIKQLVYKSYLIDNKSIGENKFYLNQLSAELHSPNTSISRSLEYKVKDLADYFLEYNSNNGGSISYYTKKQLKTYIKLVAGVDYHTLKIRNAASRIDQYNFDGSESFTFGLEIESVLPFNKNKWSLALESGYHYYKSEVVNKYDNAGSIDFRSIVLNPTLRYYIFLSKNSKFQLNAGYVVYFPNKSYVNKFLISYGHRTSVGIGYTFMNKFSLEMKYYPKKDIMFNYTFYYSDFQTLSVLVKYTLN